MTSMIHSKHELKIKTEHCEPQTHVLRIPKFYVFMPTSCYILICALQSLETQDKKFLKGLHSCSQLASRCKFEVGISDPLCLCSEKENVRVTGNRNFIIKFSYKTSFYHCDSKAHNHSIYVQSISLPTNSQLI